MAVYRVPGVPGWSCWSRCAGSAVAPGSGRPCSCWRWEISEAAAHWDEFIIRNTHKILLKNNYSLLPGVPTRGLLLCCLVCSCCHGNCDSQLHPATPLTTASFLLDCWPAANVNTRCHDAVTTSCLLLPQLTSSTATWSLMLSLIRYECSVSGPSLISHPVRGMEYWGECSASLTPSSSPNMLRRLPLTWHSKLCHWQFIITLR